MSFSGFSFKNRPPLGFDELQGEPEQTLQLVQDHDASVEYKVKYVTVWQCGKAKSLPQSVCCTCV